ncbi:MAG: hypothetical protein WC824_07850 [Bacteroidota bacterium]|jgi:hypothetical protein
MLPFDASEYKDVPHFGLSVILKTPTRIHCTNWVFPVQVGIDDILLLTPSSVVVPPESSECVSDEIWGDDNLPVHIIEVPSPIESSTWIAFPELLAPPKHVYLEINPTPLMFLAAAGEKGKNVFINKVRGTRAIVPQFEVKAKPGSMTWSDVTYRWAEMHLIMNDLIETAKEQGDELPAMTCGLVVYFQGDSSLSVALLPKTVEVLLLAPAAMVLKSQV